MNRPITSLSDRDRKHIWHPFTQEFTAPPPIAIRSGHGSTLIDDHGHHYLDLISSWWVNLHGHSHPQIAEAIYAQARSLEHVIFAGFTHEPAVELSEQICESLPAGLERVFFTDNGSGSVEVALKMAFQHWRNQGQQRSRFLCFHDGYHGDTFGAMAVGNTSGFFDPFAELLFEVDSVECPTTWLADPDVEAKEAAALVYLDHYLERHADDLAALIIEPLVQGAGGMKMYRPVFLQQVVERIQSAGSLVIFDEVMTGFGRTGRLFACHQIEAVPDIICLSKGLTGGFLPMALTICSEGIYESFLDESFNKALIHSHSYTANPLACAAALASLKLTLAPACGKAMVRIEQQHRAGLERLACLPQVARARLCGTIAAFDLNVETQGYHSRIGPWLKQRFLDQGLLIRPLGNVVYLMPPYCTREDQLDQAWSAVFDIALEIPN